MRFLARLHIDFTVSAALFLGALALYTSTMAPGITWSNDGGDGGDFLTAAFNWGVPHPTGYPTYIILLRLFAWVVPFGEPAFTANLFSATCAGAAVPLVYLISRNVIARMPESSALGTGAARSVSAVSALAFAGGSVFWSQATITEVYTLNALFAAAVLLLGLLVRARLDQRRPATALLAAFGFIAGVGLGNHVTLAIVIAPVAAWATWPLLRHIRARFRLAALPALAFVLGLSVYVYPPVASAQGPVLSWGHPHSFEGFRWIVTASIYQNYAFGVEGEDLPRRTIKVFDFLLGQYGIVAVILGVGGVATLWSRSRGFAAATLMTATGISVYAVGYSPSDSYVYLVPAFMVFAVWAAAGAASLVATVREAPSPGFRARLGPRARLLAPGCIALVLLAGPAYVIPLRFGDMNIRGDNRATDYVEQAMATAGPGSVILADGVELFSLWYHAYVSDPEDRILVVSTALLRFDWYWQDLRAQAPDRIPAARALGHLERITLIADFNEGATPVYLTHADKFYSNSFQLVPAGNLYLAERGAGAG
jgi:hypothetical protein